MLNDEENLYVEKWISVQTSLQFQRRLILGLVGLVGILVLIVLFAGRRDPLVVERENNVFIPLSVVQDDLTPTKESVSQLVTEFIKLKYEWSEFNPEKIVKNLEPVTTEGLRQKLLQELGKKKVENKEGSSIEQSVARIKPDVSEKAVLASFDRVLRINGVPIVVPTQISIMLVEGPKTAVNPIGLYVNGVLEHESR